MRPANPVLEMLGRRLRLGLIGGGPGSFIGAVHRAAARLDDRYQIVAGALASDPERSLAAGSALGLERAYPTGMDLIAAESSRADGADVVAIMTPNDSHHPLAASALEHGLDVICDKPMCNTLEDALDLVDRVERTGLVFCLTHNYTGYAMVRQAKEMVDAGELGGIRLVQVEYVQGGKAAATDPSGDELPWRYHPVRGGRSLVMGDIGSHAHNLVRFVTGLEVSEVAAEIGSIVPGRVVDDYAGALLRLGDGARGVFWVTQAAAGVENDLRIRVSGTEASVEWRQEQPNRLVFSPLAGPVQLRTPNGPGTHPLSARSTRIVAGHPDGFLEAFANIYSDAAEAIAARRSGESADPLSLHFPDAADGARALAFITAAIESRDRGGAWTEVPPVRPASSPGVD